jgi:hypothetical protein
VRRGGTRKAWTGLVLVPLLLAGTPAEPALTYKGQFVFSRIRYGGLSQWGYRGGSSWSHDYPRADEHLSRILHDLTTIDATLDGSNVFELTDREMFRYPIIYLSEPGYWTMSDEDAVSLREYLLKGGLIIFDDFEEEHLLNVEAQMRRALPELRMVEIGIDHPVFDAFTSRIPCRDISRPGTTPSSRTTTRPAACSRSSTTTATWLNTGNGRPPACFRWTSPATRTSWESTTSSTG